MKKLRTICIGVIVGMFVVNLCYTLLSLFMGDLLEINLLYSLNTSVIIISICSGLVFKTGVSPKEKWVRRGIVVLLGCILCPLSLWLFDWIEIEMLWYCAAVGASAQIWFCGVAFLIADRREKKHFEKINKKLSEKSFFESFTKEAFLVSTTETYDLYSFEYDNTKYTVLKVLKKASNHTVIRLEGENVLWEQSYPLGNRPAKDEWVVTKKSFAEKGTIGVIVFNGTPLRICGLDESGYVSCNRKVKKESDIYVLTSAELKIFEP